jgi:hypothetical protein
MTAEPEPLPNGFHLGRYVVECELGLGPMGRVYRAHDGVLNRSVAVYVLRATLRTEAGIASFFHWFRKAAKGDATAPCEGAALPVLDLSIVDDAYLAVLTCANDSDGATKQAGRPTRG